MQLICPEYLSLQKETPISHPGLWLLGLSMPLNSSSTDLSAGVGGCKVQEQGGHEVVMSAARSLVAQTVCHSQHQALQVPCLITMFLNT